MKLIIGNWKMNPQDVSTAESLARKIKQRSQRLKKTKIVLCVPYVFLEKVARLSFSKLSAGAQDSFLEADGAHTGMISPGMIRKTGATHVIIGHSEMRAQGDTNLIVNKKIKKALEYRLVVVLCIGEKERDEEGRYLSFLRDEIEESLVKIPQALFKNIVIAYEPIWAIGKNAKKAATPQDFLEKAIFIRKILSKMTDKKTAMRVPILYGGSVDEKNIEGFLREGQADGALVGRASLDAPTFNEILSISDNV